MCVGINVYIACLHIYIRIYTVIYIHTHIYITKNVLDFVELIFQRRYSDNKQVNKIKIMHDLSSTEKNIAG